MYFTVDSKKNMRSFFFINAFFEQYQDFGSSKSWDLLFVRLLNSILLITETFFVLQIIRDYWWWCGHSANLYFYQYFSYFSQQNVDMVSFYEKQVESELIFCSKLRNLVE